LRRLTDPTSCLYLVQKILLDKVFADFKQFEKKMVHVGRVGSSSNGVPVGAVVGGVLGLLAVFAVVIALLLYKRRKQFHFLDIFTVKRSKGGSLPP
jgi:hypothetical protein